MHVFLFGPFNLRHNIAGNLREFYWLIQNLHEQNVGFIASEEYFEDIEVLRAHGRWEADQSQVEFLLPSNSTIRSCKKGILKTVISKTSKNVT